VIEEPETHEDLCPPDCDCDQDDSEFEEILTAVQLGIL
jgi:hypothetical protein